MKDLKILKTDTNCVAKYLYDNRKFRIDFDNNWYSLYVTKPNSRYFHFVKSFLTIKEAKKFYYTDESFELMPEIKRFKR